MRIHEIVNEAVGGNYLYHGVPDGITMAKILKSGMLQPMEAFDFDREQENSDSPNRISLTRNQYLHFPYGNGVAQFVINRDALKQKGYKIKPVVGALIGHKDETEEQVFKPIPIAAPYVVEIQYDPDLKIPKSFLDQIKERGIKITPWRKEGRHPAVPEPKPNSPKPATEYTDPSKLILTKNDWFGDIVYTISYKFDDGSSEIIQPYYMVKNKDVAEKAYITIKNRIAQGLTFDDLLPPVQYTKSWRSGYREVEPQG